MSKLTQFFLRRAMIIIWLSPLLLTVNTGLTRKKKYICESLTFLLYRLFCQENFFIFLCFLIRNENIILHRKYHSACLPVIPMKEVAQIGPKKATNWKILNDNEDHNKASHIVGKEQQWVHQMGKLGLEQSWEKNISLKEPSFTIYIHNNWFATGSCTQTVDI